MNEVSNDQGAEVHQGATVPSQEKNPPVGP